MILKNNSVPFATKGLVYHGKNLPNTKEQWILVDGPSVIAGMDGMIISDPDTCRNLLQTDPERFILGSDATGTWFAVPVNDTVSLPGTKRLNLRSQYGILPDEMLGIASRAMALATFYRTHRFCGICGADTNPKEDETATVCTTCGHIFYPVINPVIIVCIRRGNDILLARSPHFLPRIYSIIAGFVEAGETLEHGVAREIAEEVGIEVDDVRYRLSQPWPFPHSLMIGFTASYAGGTISPDPTEIEDAGWYSYDCLPPLPAQGSISRILIDLVVQEIQDGTGS